MAYNVKTTPKLDGFNFPIWKVKMIVFLQSLWSHVVKATTKLFVHTNGNEDTWFEITVKEIETNAKAHYALFQALNDDDICRVINCTSAFDVWQNLIGTHEGTTLVKKALFA